MGAISSLSDSVGTLVDTPLLFGAGALYGLIVLPQTAAQLFGIPIVPLLLQIVTFFITPFVVAGLVAMAYQSMKQGTTSFETFKRKGRDKYVGILAGNLLQFVIAFGYFIVAGLLFFVVSIFVIGIGAGAGSAAGGPGGLSLEAILSGTALIVVLIGALFLLVYLLIVLFIQFYQPAIVVDDVGAIEGFKRSIGVVRSNLLSSVGFLAINVLVSLLLSAPVIAVFLLPFLTGSAGATAPASQPPGSGFELGLAASLGGTVMALLITTISVPFRLTYATDFYDAHS